MSSSTAIFRSKYVVLCYALAFALSLLSMPLNAQLTMIRMIDALHTQVKGLISDAQSKELIEEGEAKFEETSKFHEEIAGGKG